MDFHVEKPSLDNSNLKLERIRKNILHDVLMYNLQASNSKKNQQKMQQEREQIHFEQILQKEKFILEREEQKRRMDVFEKRRMLQREHDRQIKEKKEREEQERKYNQMYGELERQHQIYSNQRRIYDLERIYNRKSYKARIINGERRNQRVKTQPFENPESYSARKEKNEETSSKSAHKYNVNQSYDFGSPAQYKDSLDQLQVNENGNNNRGYRSINQSCQTPSAPQLETPNKKVSFM